MSRSIARLSLLLAFVLLTGTGRASTMIVRVPATTYQELSDRVDFKGTSIDIAGAVPGRSYDLILDESDLPVVRRSGLAVEVITSDLDGWKRLVATDGQYRTYADQTVLLRDYAATFPSLCVIESIGPSYEGRYIYGLKISDDPAVEDSTEPEALIYAQMHSREWATSEMALHAIDTLLRNYASDPSFRSFIDNHQLWIFPLFNVDGYTYDYPGQLWWRKNRQPFGGFIGTDMNRDGNGVCNGNPQAEWGALVPGSRTSHNPDDITFMGARGSFTPEMQALVSFVKQHSFLTELSLHSYSELVLWSYAHGEQTPDNAFISRVGQGTAAQIRSLYSGTYTPQQSNVLYPTNGSVEDWFYGWSRSIAGHPCFSLLFEVGTDFYQPTTDLDGMATQVFKGLWYFINYTDSVPAQMTPLVPRPLIAPIEAESETSYTVRWTPIKPQFNHPDRWELEELQGLTVTTDSLEGATDGWVLQGASVSGAQNHSGTKSFFLGNTSNMDNWVVTRDPFPVVSADDSVTFWVWHNLEADYDVGVCEVSLEGKEWFQLHDRYTGSSSGWVRRAYSLAPWLGKSVFIRLRSMSDDGTNQGGMYVDDIYPLPVFATRTVISDTIADPACTFTNKPSGHYYYRVRGHNAAWGWGDQGPLQDILVSSSAVADRGPGPGAYRTALSVAPTLFVDRAGIAYSLGREGRVRIRILDASGRQVRELVNATGKPGSYRVNWDGRDANGRAAANGAYLCELKADRMIVTRIALLH